jgi:hypothetical protein
MESWALSRPVGPGSAATSSPVDEIQALGYHLDIARALRTRPPGGRRYRALLQSTLRLDLDRYVVSTAEHIAPFNRSHTVSFLLPHLTLADGTERPPAVLILAGSLIPLDNGHYPRGFLLPDRAERRTRFNLFPQRQQKCSPLLVEAVDERRVPGLAELLDRHPFLGEAFRQAQPGESYAWQMARCMSALARRWLGSDGPAPDVRVVPLEDVARRMLIQLLEGGDECCEAVLLDPDSRELLRRRLTGVFCAWGERQGSFLFWAASRGKVERLRERGGLLLNDTFQVPFDRASLIAALRAGTIVPGVFLSLFTVAYLPNLPVAGGLKQAQYFPRMLEALNEVTGLARSASLGVVGYGTLQVETMRTAANGPFFRDWGCGLGIAESGFDRHHFREQLRMMAIDLTPPQHYVLA